MPVDVTKYSDNPAWDIRRLYQSLMEIAKTEPELAVARCAGIVDSMTGHGISPNKAHIFKTNLQNALKTGNWATIRNDVTGAVQAVISHFLLGAMGMSAEPAKFHGRMEGIDIESLANLLSEDDLGFKIEMTRDTKDMIALANRYGFVVGEAKEEDRWTCDEGILCEAILVEEMKDKYIQKVGDDDKPWCIVSKHTGRHIACYPSKAQARANWKPTMKRVHSHS